MKRTCAMCKKKLSKFSLEFNTMCHCEKYHCTQHFNPSYHACTFDYQKQRRIMLTTQNPTIIPNKVSQI